MVRRTRPSWLVTTGAIAAVERQTASGISLASGSTAKSRFEVRGRSVTRGGLCLVPIADRRDSHHIFGNRLNIFLIKILQTIRYSFSHAACSLTLRIRRARLEILDELFVTPATNAANRVRGNVWRIP